MRLIFFLPQKAGGDVPWEFGKSLRETDENEFFLPETKIKVWNVINYVNIKHAWLYRIIKD